MANGPAYELQRATIAALKGATDLSAMVSDRIYDEPPDNAIMPYIRLGGIEPLPMRTTGTEGRSITFGIEVHSRPDSGRVEATLIAEAVVALLDNAPALLVMDGYRLFSLEWLTQTTGRESDGKTYLAIIAFQALIEPDGS